MNSINQMC